MTDSNADSNGDAAPLYEYDVMLKVTGYASDRVLAPSATEAAAQVARNLDTDTQLSRYLDNLMVETKQAEEVDE